jgi:hypothetical protein
MAIRYAVATGNWSNTATWNGGTLPTSADDVYANGFTVTINQNVTVVSLNNTATTGVTVGGGFQMGAGANYTIVCSTINAGSQTCLILASVNAMTTIVANSINGALTPLTGTGLAITNASHSADITANFNAYNASALSLTAALNITINGNIIANANSNASLIRSGNLTVNGYAQGGSPNAFAMNFDSNIVGLIATITKAISINNGAAGVACTGGSSPSVTVKEIEQGNFGQIPILGYVRLSTASGAFYKGVTTGSSTRTLSDPADIAGQVPAESDVRFGVTYQSGSKTGSAYIPAASSVGFGVPVDNTTGTAALTPASVWDAATSSLTTSGSIGERLKNASTVDTTGDQLAALL